MEENLDCYASDAPVCPHCGTVDEEWWFSCPLEGDTEPVCPDCGKKYQLNHALIHQFTTEPIEGWGEDEEI